MISTCTNCNHPPRFIYIEVATQADLDESQNYTGDFAASVCPDPACEDEIHFECCCRCHDGICLICREKEATLPTKCSEVYNDPILFYCSETCRESES